MAIELLPGIEGVVTVPIDSIVTLWEAGFPGAEVLQEHRPLNKTHVRRLSESNGRWPAIQLVKFRNPSISIGNYQVLSGYALVDGRHRLEAAKKLKYNVIRAEVASYPTIEEVVQTANLANSQHGIPSSPNLRTAHALWLYHQIGDDMPISAIASIAGVVPATLKAAINRESKQYERQDEQITDLPPIAKFALDLYKSLSILREQSEQDGLFYDNGEDMRRVVNMFRGVLHQLPPRDQEFVIEFLKIVAGILNNVVS